MADTRVNVGVGVSSRVGLIAGVIVKDGVPVSVRAGVMDHVPTRPGVCETEGVVLVVSEGEGVADPVSEALSVDV